MSLLIADRKLKNWGELGVRKPLPLTATREHNL